MYFVLGWEEKEWAREGKSKGKEKERKGKEGREAKEKGLGKGQLLPYSYLIQVLVGTLLAALKLQVSLDLYSVGTLLTLSFRYPVSFIYWSFINLIRYLDTPITTN